MLVRNSHISIKTVGVVAEKAHIFTGRIRSLYNQMVSSIDQEIKI